MRTADPTLSRHQSMASIEWSEMADFGRRWKARFNSTALTCVRWVVGRGGPVTIETGSGGCGHRGRAWWLVIRKLSGHLNCQVHSHFT